MEEGRRGDGQGRGPRTGLEWAFQPESTVGEPREGRKEREEEGKESCTLRELDFLFPRGGGRKARTKRLRVRIPTSVKGPASVRGTMKGAEKKEKRIPTLCRD